MENELNNENILSVSSEVIVSLLIDGLLITKETNQKMWASDDLEYTITIINQTNKEYFSPVIVDKIDTSLVMLDKNSITINGSPGENKYTFDEDTGVLEISTQNLDPLSKTIITFKVIKK